jgi:hypothetical protein
MPNAESTSIIQILWNLQLDYHQTSTIMLELVAYINTSGRPSRREHSERRDSDVHGAGVYWPIGVIKFARGTIRLWGCRGNAPCGTVRGYFRDSVQFSTESVQVHTVRHGIRTRRVLSVIDVNLDYYQNNSCLSVDVGKLPNHVKSVSLSLDLSLFDSIYCSSLLCAVTTDNYDISNS